MYGIVGCSMMMSQVMDLGVTVMAAGDAVICTGCDNLVVFQLAIIPPGISEPGLEEPAAATTAIVVRSIRRHLDDIFRTNHRFDDKAQIICHRISIAFPDDLTGVLNGKGNSALFIPVGVYLQPAFANPLCVVLIDRGNFKVMVYVEFFQSGPD